MKPTEILDAIIFMERDICELEAQIAPLRSKLDTLVWARADIRVLLDSGADWAKIRERIDDVSVGITTDPSKADEATEPFAGIVSVKPAALRRDGQPKQKPGRKPKADPSTSTKAERPSPLTPDLRAKLEATLGAGPMTLDGIKRMSWTAGLDVEALLCEDPAAFVSWIDPSSLTQARVWGLAEQFDRAVISLDLQCSKVERASYVAQELGCSLAAATEAWYRIDMGAS